MWIIQIDTINKEVMELLDLANDEAKFMGFNVSLNENNLILKHQNLMGKIDNIQEHIEAFVKTIGILIAELSETKVIIFKDKSYIFEHNGHIKKEELTEEIRDLEHKIGLKMVKWLKSKV